jgi:hypothetical protein
LEAVEESEEEEEVVEESEEEEEVVEESEEEEEAVEESEEEEEVVEESEEEEEEEVRVSYYHPLRSLKADDGKMCIDAMLPRIAMDEKMLDSMRISRVMKADIHLDNLIALGEVGVKLMKLEKLIYITISKDVYSPDIVRRTFDRYTEVLVEQDENMSKHYSEGGYLDAINKATKHREHIEDILVSLGVLPVPKPDYL